MNFVIPKNTLLIVDTMPVSSSSTCASVLNAPIMSPLEAVLNISSWDFVRFDPILTIPLKVLSKISLTVLPIFATAAIGKVVSLPTKSIAFFIP